MQTHRRRGKDEQHICAGASEYCPDEFCLVARWHYSLHRCQMHLSINSQ